MYLKFSETQLTSTAYPFVSFFPRLRDLMPVVSQLYQRHLDKPLRPPSGYK